MLDKFKQLMEMKKQADQIKRELDASKFECNDVRGIKIVINGSQEFQSIQIEENLLRPENKIQLERDLMRAVNSSVRKSQNSAAQKMKDLMPNFPGLS